MAKGLHAGEGGRSLEAWKGEHLGQIKTGALESGFSLFPVPTNSKPQLEQVC